MIVVGNDEDATEFILEPIYQNIEARTVRGKRAVAQVIRLRNSLIGYLLGE